MNALLISLNGDFSDIVHYPPAQYRGIIEHLFLLYDVHSGKVHWAFYPGKVSSCVCRFMQRIRHWYPTQEV